MTASRLCLAVLAGLLITAPAFGHDTKVGSLEIEHPWARATAASAQTGAAYLEILNRGTTPDRLIGAASPAAAKVELHTHIRDGGVMKMRPVEAIDLAPAGSVKLAPGGLHIMLLGLTQPLTKGAMFPLTLTFEQAGAVTVEVAIQGPGDGAPSHASEMHHGDMPGGMTHKP
ncbi:MAG: copper chaperone PCu(A)C [Azospirillum sp.]|nr:copper chaperone PCu(A)C [Azospirillum sp.]